MENFIDKKYKFLGDVTLFKAELARLNGLIAGETNPTLKADLMQKKFNHIKSFLSDEGDSNLLKAAIALKTLGTDAGLTDANRSMTEISRIYDSELMSLLTGQIELLNSINEILSARVKDCERQLGERRTAEEPVTRERAAAAAVAAAKEAQETQYVKSLEAEAQNNLFGRIWKDIYTDNTTDDGDEPRLKSLFSGEAMIFTDQLTEDQVMQSISGWVRQDVAGYMRAVDRRSKDARTTDDAFAGNPEREIDFYNPSVLMDYLGGTRNEEGQPFGKIGDLMRVVSAKKKAYEAAAEGAGKQDLLKELNRFKLQLGTALNTKAYIIKEATYRVQKVVEAERAKAEEERARARAERDDRDGVPNLDGLEEEDLLEIEAIKRLLERGDLDSEEEEESGSYSEIGIGTNPRGGLDWYFGRQGRDGKGYDFEGSYERAPDYSDLRRLVQ